MKEYIFTNTVNLAVTTEIKKSFFQAIQNEMAFIGNGRNQFIPEIDGIFETFFFKIRIAYQKISIDIGRIETECLFKERLL